MSARRPAARPTQTIQPGGLDLFGWAWKLLTNVKFALFLVGLALAAGIIGVVLPQVPGPMRGNPAARSAWLELRRGTYGPLGSWRTWTWRRRLDPETIRSPDRDAGWSSGFAIHQEALAGGARQGPGNSRARCEISNLHQGPCLRHESDPDPLWCRRQHRSTSTSLPANHLRPGFQEWRDCQPPHNPCGP